MASPQALLNEDERLPLLIGFQRVAENTARTTRFIERGKGVYVYDTDGREYIEATASFYVAALGYMHDELIDAIHAQYRDLPFVTSALHRTSKSSLELAELLRDIVPVPDAHILFGTTGSEANDFLVKLLYFQSVVRGQPERRTIIARHGSYHGGTLATASLTGAHHEEFGLPLPGFLHVSQPDYHGDRKPGETPDEFSARLAQEFEDLVNAQPNGSIAAFFTEPVSFSAGLKVPPAAYFPNIAEVLKRHEIALVADEVITGFGRTGALFGSDTFGLQPDHAVIAKGITSGYFPLSAVAIGSELYADLETGSDRVGTFAHAATYAAHPVGAAAALKVMEIIERDGLVAHAANMGQRLAARLETLGEHPLIGDVRHCGLAGALDFLRRGDDDQPLNDHADADAVCLSVYERVLDAGVVTRPAGRSLVIAPPLIVQEAEIDEICERIARALDLEEQGL